MSYESDGVYETSSSKCSQCGSYYTHYKHLGPNPGVCTYCRRGCSELNPDSVENQAYRRGLEEGRKGK